VDTLKGIAATIAIIALGLVIVWGVQGNDFFMYKYFAPKYEDVRRETFEHSRAYNQGMIQELENMYLSYQTADDSHKKALSSVVIHRYADYNDTNLPNHLRQFVASLRSQR
jgi:hypothetical protein